jgi:hypothetical protein
MHPLFAVAMAGSAGVTDGPVAAPSNPDYNWVLGALIMTWQSNDTTARTKVYIDSIDEANLRLNVNPGVEFGAAWSGTGVATRQFYLVHVKNDIQSEDVCRIAVSGISAP